MGNSPGMADRETDTADDRVTSVPLPTNVGAGADRVIAQQNQGPEVAAGGGEWPSLDAPPSDAAPGGPPPRIATGGRPKGAFGDEAGDGDGEFPNMKDVLDADPVAGGSQSTATGDEDGDGAEGASEGGADDDRWGGSRLP